MTRFNVIQQPIAVSHDANIQNQQPFIENPQARSFSGKVDDWILGIGSLTLIHNLSKSVKHQLVGISCAYMNGTK